MSLVHEVFARGEFFVEAGRLEDHAHALAVRVELLLLSISDKSQTIAKLISKALDVVCDLFAQGITTVFGVGETTRIIRLDRPFQTFNV